MNECTTIRLKALNQLLPIPDRARISGPTGPEILVSTYFPKAWLEEDVVIPGIYLDVNLQLSQCHIIC